MSKQSEKVEKRKGKLRNVEIILCSLIVLFLCKASDLFKTH